jgi:putative colanic acid biosynthesis UDP-glucose lipid carrier transferase
VRARRRKKLRAAAVANLPPPTPTNAFLAGKPRRASAMTALPASSSEKHGLGALAAPLQRLPLDAFGLVAILSDLVSVVIAGVLTGSAYNWIAFGRIGTLGDCWQIGTILGVLTAVLMYFRGMHVADSLLSTRSQIASIALTWITAFAFVVAAGWSFNVGNHFIHGWGPSFAIAAPTLIVIHRLLLQRLLATVLAKGWVRRRKILVITDAAASSSFEELQRSHNVLRTYILPHDPQHLRDFLDRMTDLLAAEDCVDEVHIAVDWTNWSRAKWALSGLRALPVPVRLVADANASEILRHRQRILCGTVSFELQRAPLTAGGHLVKRLFDMTAAGFGLLVLAPLLVAIAVAVRVDSGGPVLFRQKRGGFNGRAFHILKFRTMHVLEDGPRVDQATQHDDRVTRVGRFLRCSSLDELPQLINVLRGDMSLVGPRPHALAHDDTYRALISIYPFRHYVKPGITGWAQVNGFRGETPTLALMKRRVDFDLWYACNWSLWLDLRILFGTVRAVCRARNAF